MIQPNTTGAAVSAIAPGSRAHARHPTAATPPLLGLLMLAFALLLGSQTALAQFSTLPTTGGGGFSPIPGGGTGGSALGDLFGTPSTPAGGGMCSAPAAGATCDGSGPAALGNTSGTNTGAGNPINLINGNKYQVEVDMPALPGELGIEIVRHYNSASRHVIGQLGMGWRLSYETDLYVVGQTVQILQADGARLTFNIDPKNPSLCAGADPAQGWVEIRAGVRGGKEYWWHWTQGEHAGRRLLFDDQGKLVQIVAASGAVLSLTHGPKGELLKVTDPQGRSLLFNHASKDSVRAAQQDARNTLQQTALFTGIKTIDSPVGRFSYEHGVKPTADTKTDAQASPEAQALARAQAANLTQVSLPTHNDPSQHAHGWSNRSLSSSTINRQYHYEDKRHPLALTGISVLGSGSDGQMVHQRLSTYLYNAQGQANLSVKGEPARLDATATDGHKRLEPGTGIEQVYVRILQPALHNKAGVTLLANSLGQQTVYRHQIIGGQYRLVEARGAGCAQCGPVNMRWGYDSVGRLIEQTMLAPTPIPVSVTPEHLANNPSALATALPPAQPLLTTRHTLDALGRTQRIEQIAYVDGKAQPARLIERHEYTDARWPDKPTLLARPSVVAGLEQQIALTYNEAGQVTELKESGFSPLNAQGEAAASVDQATRIERSTTYTYNRINGRSLLVATDGPLPNGPTATPADSDISRFEWDAKGSFMLSVSAPGDLNSTISYDDTTGHIERVLNDVGFATTFTRDARQQLVRISSQGPGWAQAQVQSFQFDALGQPVQSFEGDATQPEGAAKASDTTPARPTLRQAFDAQGRPLWRANALGMLQTWQHNSESQPVQMSRLSNRILQRQQIEYDELGRPVAWGDNAGRGGLLRYGSNGLPEAYQDALGRRIEPGGLGQSTNTRSPAKGDTPRRAARILDDFGNNVLTRSADSGTTLREFDQTGRLLAMTDALGNRAIYAYDAQGRILRQTVTDARTQEAVATQWRYAGRHLVEVIHPTQSERFEVDARGLRTARIVTLNTPQGALTSVTRYEHDERGQLVATSLPDGSRLVVQRNGQNQVVALRRQSIQTPWLRWLGAEQVVAQDFERDLVGLSRYTSGNGIEALQVRSREGALARTLYRHSTPKAALQARGPGAPLLMGRSTQETIERLLGITAAHAQNTPAQPASAQNAGAAAADSTLPGALGLPADPQALIDHRYLWSTGGHLLLNQQRAGSGTGANEPTQMAHAYNTRGQLVASVLSSGPGVGAEAGQAILSPVSSARATSPAQVAPIQERAVWRYAYDASQRRILGQQGAQTQADLNTGTQRSQFQDASHRLQSMAGQGESTYNANGQPERVGQREYVWDALGRLVQVREEAKPLAQYQYDHRGLRISKVVNTDTAFTQFTLYDESRQPLAELNAQGQIQRQYIYLADLSLAVIDTPQGKALGVQCSALQQVWVDVQQIASTWLGASGEAMVWLHTNHLGAPEAATDAQGQIVWRASYAPFGAATVVSLPAGERVGVRGTLAHNATNTTFTLNLRLSGQVFDTEIGLHYNRQRYYDPGLGQYLTPDPLGTPDGPNPYAYVAFNPLSNVDPDGLVLFAFDGTGNSNDQATLNELGNGLSNVWQFRQLYDDGNARYVTGVGTRHREADRQFGGDIHWSWGNTSTVDMGANYTGPDRIARMVAYFNAEAELFTDDSRLMDVDIIGFSRGAAQARDFANRINAATRNGQYRYTITRNGRHEQRCQMINFRFMGLWDTVLSSNLSGTGYNLGIVPGFQHVAQAVALNEYRGDTFRRLPNSTGAFPLESIMRGAVPVGQTRIERGFIGAHADIGGGFAGETNALPLVALNWMVEQARDAGVNMSNPRSTIGTSSVIHDKSDNQYCLSGPGCSEDRTVRGGAGGTQRQMIGTGMTHADTRQFISYYPPGIYADGRQRREPRADASTGTVDITRYLQWLRDNGYNFGNLRVQ